MSLSETTKALLKSKYHTDLGSADTITLYNALSAAAMERLEQKWADTRAEQVKGRQACYLSAEFLIGRMVYNNLMNMGLLDEAGELFDSVGRSINELELIEDAALGNGGLGRLAACFLDSAATLGRPLVGYGIRYKYGLFRQSIQNGRQVELPDDWERFGDPWSRKREDLRYKIEFRDKTVIACAYDIPIIPYGSDSINTLRLFEASSEQEFDFALFNEQKYDAAVRARNDAERIHFCLYPNDDKRPGKLLRLMQEYFFSSAAIQDMLCCFEKQHGSDYARFSDYFAIQLNDTHPTLAIPELINQLTARGVDFDAALDIARRSFAYTNHTIMEEALERWDKRLLRSLLPNILDIIIKINTAMNRELIASGVSNARIEAMQIADRSAVNMARLACYVCYSINGVAKLHSEIIKRQTLSYWYNVYPERFNNKTNGITPRRWLRLCNPELSALITEHIGDGWITDLSQLKRLEPLADDPNFRQRFFEIKRDNKRRLCAYIAEHDGVQLDPDSIFDIQIKRLHEYKRQLLNILCVLYLYYGVKDGSIQLDTPVSVIFGAKAAPGYRRAKAIIKLINEVAALISSDASVSRLIKVVFVQNYNVSYAERLVTAADISEQISTAGTEASGTGNMKFMLNGTLTLGTYDGANIEIVQAAGEENNYIFGARVEQLDEIRDSYDPKKIYKSNAAIARVLDALTDGTLDDDGSGDFAELKSAILEGASWHKPDHYFLLQDFESYVTARLRCYNDYKNRDEYMKKCILNTANSGIFSSDRTISEYCKDIWRI